MRGHLWHKRDFTAKNVEIRTASTGGKRPKHVKWASVVATGPSVRLDIARPINELYDDLLCEDPAYLQTHPNTLLGLIERSQEIGAVPNSLREARTFGEPLEPQVREAAREHWNVPVVDNYSAMETGTIAHQCPETTNLHVQGEGVLVEVLDDDGRPCRPGETGRVVLTALHNFATPLIRYDIGDYARVGHVCSCGRGLPVLERVVGRERNLLVYPSGDRQFPEVRFGTLEPIAPIRQFQLTQKTVERIEVTLAVPRLLTGDEEAALRASTRSHAPPTASSSSSSRRFRCRARAEPPPMRSRFGLPSAPSTSPAIDRTPCPFSTRTRGDRLSSLAQS